MILTKKLQENQNYHQAKLINVKILHAKKFSFSKNFWETTKKNLENQAKNKVKLKKF